jgi:electron transfer flavoprotein alpha subunit
MEERVRPGFNNILVYMETDETGAITQVSLEALNAAKQIARDQSAAVGVFLVGDKMSSAADELQFHGVDMVYLKEDDRLKSYQPKAFLKIFERVYDDFKPELIVFSNSINSLDFSGRIAFRLDAGLITDCVKIESEENDLFFTKPVYSNNIMVVYSCSHAPCIITVRAKSAAPSERSEKKEGEIVHVDEEIDLSQEEYDVVEKVIQKDEGMNLADASIIVSGGRGVGGAEGFGYLKELADLLGGHIGSTRPPCDMGWVSPGAQVGITGTIVSPSLYIAIGISGSFQHMAGMIDSKVVIAINCDPDANIFKISNYGVIGEYEEVLPGFIEGVKDSIT